MKRIVVTGLGMINALGLDKESAFSGIIDGKCGITNIESFDTEKHSVKIAGEIKNFDPLTVLDAKEVKKADRFIHLGLKAAAEAMEDAKLPEDVDMETFGVASASGIGGLPNIQKNSIVCENRGPRRISPFFIPSSLVNMLGGFVSIYQNLKGPNLSSVTACAAGTHAIGEAAKSIMVGTADKMLVIGAESAICGAGMGGFAAMKALSTNNENPKGASRPFDANRDGFVITGGGGIVVMEELEHALQRNAHIYAEVVGYGATSDGADMVKPSGEGALRCMQQATSTVDTPIDYINTHATSTPAGDIAELNAIKELFGDDAPRISGTKSLTGHGLGAAGANEAIYSLLMMNDDFIAASANITELDEGAAGMKIVTQREDNAGLNTIMSNSFGFGGTNATLVFKRPD